MFSEQRCTEHVKLNIQRCTRARYRWAPCKSSGSFAMLEIIGGRQIRSGLRGRQFAVRAQSSRVDAPTSTKVTRADIVSDFQSVALTRCILIATRARGEIFGLGTGFEPEPFFGRTDASEPFQSCHCPLRFGDIGGDCCMDWGRASEAAPCSAPTRRNREGTHTDAGASGSHQARACACS